MEGCPARQFAGRVIKVLERVQHVHQLWRHFGGEWLAYRVGYAARTRLGWLRRKLPVTSWEACSLASFLDDPTLAEPTRYRDYRSAQAPAFFFAPSARTDYQHHFADWDKGDITPVASSEQMAQGRMRYFERVTAHAGFPPDWHANPFTKERAPADLHWSQIGDYGYGDIKIIWEPSRFGFAYTLTRAYWRTGDNHYAEMFWRAVEDWRAKNPPQQGPNWKCGQETAFRVMAWCFALYGLMEAAATTAARVANLAQVIGVSAHRIQANIDYALSQRNNHGISEALGLWTAGALFPEFRDAANWQAMGRAALESQARELIYTDGSFAQHSVNYHRLMLHDYLWALRLGDILKQPFSDELRAQISQACDWLMQLQDEASGRVPYYGQNDGALILPLNNCDYQDFRPVIQAAHYLIHRTRAYEAGPWDEDLLWLFGRDALAAPVEKPARRNFQAEAGGYYTLRSAEGFVSTRAATFRHRPAQADLLHVDVWWRGQNIAMDAGTFSYNAPAPWNNPLAHTAYHNTVSVDGRDQMERVRKFVWLPWARGRVGYFNHSESLAYFEGVHDGYARLNSPVLHRRAIVRVGEHWLVVDDLQSAAEHLYRLHWLLADMPYEWNPSQGALRLDTTAGPYYVQAAALDVGGSHTIVRADATSPRGWRAPYYNYREPALSLALTARANAMRFISLFGPEPCEWQMRDEQIEWQTVKQQATVKLNPQARARQSNSNVRPPLVASVVMRGALNQRLEIA